MKFWAIPDVIYRECLRPLISSQKLCLFNPTIMSATVLPTNVVIHLFSIINLGISSTTASHHWLELIFNRWHQATKICELTTK